MRRFSATASGRWRVGRQFSRLAWWLPLMSCRIEGKVVAGALGPVERLAHAGLLQPAPLRGLAIQVERAADGLQQARHIRRIEYESGGAAFLQRGRIRIDHGVDRKSVV